MTRLDDSGSVLLEQALVLPVVLAVLFGALQLTLLQHARIACEVAAFQAARAGIVQGADPQAMTRAAWTALLPTQGPTHGPAAFATTAAARAPTLLASGAGPGRPAGYAALVPGAVWVEVLSPTAEAIRDPARSAHLGGRELDFDDLRPEVIDHTLLAIRVHTLHRLRIPFADRVLQDAWLLAQRARGPAALTDPRVLRVLALRQAGVYVLPLSASQVMRMQSNPRLASLEPSR